MGGQEGKEERGEILGGQGVLAGVTVLGSMAKKEGLTAKGTLEEAMWTPAGRAIHADIPK